MSKLWGPVKYRLSKIPIVGSLFEIRASAQREALIEISLSVIFSTLPIWFSSLILSISPYFEANTPEERTVSEFFRIYREEVFTAVSNGELLMYVAAALGPTLYLGLSSFGKKKKPFPWVRPQLVIAILINFVSAVLFFTARDKGYAAEPSFVYASATLYLVSLTLLFPAMAFNQEQEGFNPAEAQQEDQDSFQSGYREHRG